jgi:Zn-dependent peptidase ImmA (M78 family)
VGHFVDRSRHQNTPYAFQDLRDDKSNTPFEWYAEHFAANLLMPAPQFRAKVSDGYSNDELMDYFGVSHAAVESRRRSLAI